jgi:immune inhibitor A
VSTFTDDLGWYPGIEMSAAGKLYYRDADASTVVPSRGNAPYSTRFVDSAGNPLTEYYGMDIGLATPLGSGNPADDGVGYGTVVTVTKALSGNEAAQIKVTAPKL